MLEGIGSSLIGLLLNLLGGTEELATVPLVSWQDAEIFALPAPDPSVEALIEQYLQSLSNRGISRRSQGVWIQSNLGLLTHYQGTEPASAASITKVATTLAAIQAWGVNHRFETRIYITGEVQNGAVTGDLIVLGGGDPFFVWEEAIALGNALNEVGIQEVEGNLIVADRFTMNYSSDPVMAGRLLRQALDYRLWSPVIERQYLNLPVGTPRPQLAIAGTVLVDASPPPTARLLLNRQSLTLAEILKQMNIYSNNEMAEILAESVGGAASVARLAAQAARVPTAEIQLINGSGLGVENRISPRAACQMFIAIERLLQDETIELADLFPVAGRNRRGTMLDRSFPPGTIIKTGTLNQVSALAGMIPTEDRGAIWFAFINNDGNVLELRAAQDWLLENLTQDWQLAASSTASRSDAVYLGDPRRNRIVSSEPLTNDEYFKEQF
ncbi:MAG: D-alanyl-D-alanine carboxypeptidase [Cyanophyceae cyanobacterium]